MNMHPELMAEAERVIRSVAANCDPWEDGYDEAVASGIVAQARRLRAKLTAAVPAGASSPLDARVQEPRRG